MVQEHLPFRVEDHLAAVARGRRRVPLREIVDDLDMFRDGKECYASVGKAWKRGYLLFGPPGTGKSTLIAAMANYLDYDIYDLELTAVKSNTDLRKLFIETTGKSIIVIEDIDLRKLFIMDMHIEMSYCSFEAFKVLAKNYLDITGDHEFFGEIRRLLEETDMTPAADVAENLMPRSKNRDVDACLAKLVKALKEETLPKPQLPPNKDAEDKNDEEGTDEDDSDDKDSDNDSNEEEEEENQKNKTKKKDK